MFDPKTPVENTIFLYMFLVLILLYLKPSFLFHSDGKLKSFGCGNNKTIINFPIIITSFAVIMYFIFALIKKLI